MCGLYSVSNWKGNNRQLLWFNPCDASTIRIQNFNLYRNAKQSTYSMFNSIVFQRRRIWYYYYIRSQWMEVHTTRAISNAPMEGVLSAHPTTLHTRADSTASTTTPNSSRRKATTAKSRVAMRRSRWLRRSLPQKLLQCRVIIQWKKNCLFRDKRGLRIFFPYQNALTLCHSYRDSRFAGININNFFVDRKERLRLFPIDNQRADRSKPETYSIWTS